MGFGRYRLKGSAYWLRYLLFGLRPKSRQAQVLTFGLPRKWLLRQCRFLVDCSGYHVAAFSLVFRIFLLGASLRQCAPPQKQALAPSSLGYGSFLAPTAMIYMKYEVPCKMMQGTFSYIQVSSSEEAQCDSERRAGDVWLERKA